MKKYFYCGLLAATILVTAGFWRFTAPPVAGEAKSGVMVGDRLPVFTVTNSAGEPIVIGPGTSPVVLNFWATWCPPCRTELPELAQFARNNEGAVQFYGIDLQESPQVVEAFLAEQKLVLPVVYDRDGQTARMFAVRFIPTTIVTDAQGIIVFRKSGPVTAEELTGVLNQ